MGSTAVTAAPKPHRWRLALGLGLLTMVSTASFAAQYPENGWWWRADESGQGYALERQGDEIFFAAYSYDDRGEPLFFTGFGSYLPRTDGDGIGDLSIDTYESHGGTCPNCAQQAPNTTLARYGALNIHFVDGQHAELSWAGTTVPIQRVFYRWQTALQQLEGQWVVRLGQGWEQVRISADGADAAALRTPSGEARGRLIKGADNTLQFDPEDGVGAPMPLRVIETNRFLAGGGELFVLGLRVDDLPLAPPPSSELPAGMEKFSSNVTVSPNGDSILIETDDVPSHRSPYFQAHDARYEAPRQGMVVNPNRIASQSYRFNLPADPAIAAQPSDNNLDAIGVAINGVVLFNQYAGRTPSGWLPLDQEIQTFDQHNGHPAQRGNYHYHLEPIDLTVSDPAALVGFALDGFPIYGPRDSNGSVPQLDSCNGHSGNTVDYPSGRYHYHITAVVPYILGCYRGTPGTVSN